MQRLILRYWYVWTLYINKWAYLIIISIQLSCRQFIEIIISIIKKVFLQILCLTILLLFDCPIELLLQFNIYHVCCEKTDTISMKADVKHIYYNIIIINVYLLIIMLINNRKHECKCRAPVNWTKISEGHISIIRWNYLKYKNQTINKLQKHSVT